MKYYVCFNFAFQIFRWYHKVSGLLQEIRSGAAVFVRPQLSVLQFPRVQLSDSSMYICIVSNDVGEDTREMKLTVFSPIIVFIRPQKQVIYSLEILITLKHLIGFSISKFETNSKNDFFFFLI